MQGNLLCFSFCPLPLVLSLGTTEKSLAPSSLHFAFSYLYTLIRSALSLLFSRLNSPSALGLSSCERCFSPFDIFPVLHWTLQYVRVSLVLDKRSTGHSTPAIASSVLSRGEGSCSSACWQYFASCSPGYHAHSLQQVFDLVSTRTLMSFSDKLLSSWVAPAYIDVWSCSSPGAGLCTSLCWTSWGNVRVCGRWEDTSSSLSLWSQGRFQCQVANK